jgi:EAL domain-containing protein (putative c-di-GMP-specific phosphodiesterase class I)
MKAHDMSKGSLPPSESPVTYPPAFDEGLRTPSKDIPSTVLVVDDNEPLREAYRRLLIQAGMGTVAAPSAIVALELLKNGQLFDVIVSDIVMPGMDGTALLREVRKYNLDVPVILVTANPGLTTAMAAVQFGAFRYLVKPVPPADLVKAVREAIRLHRLARLKREALTLLVDDPKQLGDRASLEVYFEMALEKLWMAFQPIVGWHNRELMAYEALVRSADSRLSNPALLFDAAERLGRVRELGRKIRQLVAERISQAPAGVLIFVNLHSSDLEDADLSSPQAALSQHAHRVVLEVTERSSLDLIHNVTGRVARLRTLGYRMAVDDLGAGYAGLTTFVSLEPEFVKLDMALIRNIESFKRHQSLVRSLISLCARELGIYIVCEGVETEAERDTLESLGANLMQGYLFGRPAEGFAPAIFERPAV